MTFGAAVVPPGTASSTNNSRNIYISFTKIHLQSACLSNKYSCVPNPEPALLNPV